MQSELIEIMNESIDNAHCLLQKTNGREALINYELVKSLCEIIKQQDSSFDRLTDVCIQAADSIIENKRFVDIIKTYVSEDAWRLFNHEFKRKRCACS